MSTTQQPQVQVQRPPESKAYGKFIALGVVVVLLLIYVFQNTESQKFTFLFWSFNLPMWLMLLITLVVGFLIGLITGALLRRRKRREMRRRAQAA